MFIKQDELAIRNATIDDAPILGKWWRDGAIMAHAGFPKGLHITDNEIATQLSTDTDETRRRLIIEHCNIPIGEMAYYNKGNGVAEIGIKICDFEKQERGHGTRLLKMLIKELFYQYGYTKIILDTNLNNKRAQYVYEKLGFRKVRVNMNSWKNQLGELESSVDYEMTRNDFEGGIVKFNLKDKNELLELDKECFGVNHWDNELWQEILGDLEHNIIYLVKQNTELIAYLTIFNWGKEKNYVKITSIGTKSCFRGQKLAHKLLETMINEMKKEGMKDFRGETRVTNYPMQKIFSDFGFRSVETLKEYYDNPTEDALRYHLSI